MKQPSSAEKASGKPAVSPSLVARLSQRKAKPKDVFRSRRSPATETSAAPPRKPTLLEHIAKSFKGEKQQSRRRAGAKKHGWSTASIESRDDDDKEEEEEEEEATVEETNKNYSKKVVAAADDDRKPLSASKASEDEDEDDALLCFDIHAAFPLGIAATSADLSRRPDNPSATQLFDNANIQLNPDAPEFYPGHRARPEPTQARKDGTHPARFRFFRPAPLTPAPLLSNGDDTPTRRVYSGTPSRNVRHFFYSTPRTPTQMMLPSRSSAFTRPYSSPLPGMPMPHIFHWRGIKVTIVDTVRKIFVVDLVGHSICDLILRLTEDYIKTIGKHKPSWRKLYSYTTMDLPCCEVPSLPKITEEIMGNVTKIIGAIFRSPEKAALLKPRTWKEPHLLRYQRIDGQPEHRGVELHYDGSHITWQLMLSDVNEYSGKSCRFLMFCLFSLCRHYSAIHLTYPLPFRLFDNNKVVVLTSVVWNGRLNSKRAKSWCTPAIYTTEASILLQASETFSFASWMALIPRCQKPVIGAMTRPNGKMKSAFIESSK